MSVCLRVLAEKCGWEARAACEEIPCPLSHSSEHPRRAVAVAPDPPCPGALRSPFTCVICFPGGFQTWKISTASPPASLGNVTCGVVKSSLFSRYKIGEELSLSVQGKACHCCQTVRVYPARQGNVEEST